ncbi:MAG: hypothetical protein ABI556_04420, partial [Gemmatimonadales bacterium]
MHHLSLTPAPFANSRAIAIGALVCAASLAGCKDASAPVAPGSRSVDAPPSEPVYTLGSGSSSVLLGRANFSEPSNPNFKVKRITGDWQMELKAKPSFDLAVQTITFQPGGQSGWHSHPGPVFIQ